MSFDFNALTDSLQETTEKSQGKGVSFAKKSLKLNTEEDAKQIAEEIEKCEYMEYLDLEGNTLGPDAAKEISKAIEKNGKNLKRALWKDMFTGRMKDEIPVALEHFGRGLCLADTHLVELDLSDNAFGPIGVKGLASLLSSSPCFTLQELRLNNNGLGITGGKLLAQALSECHAKSLKETSKPLGLKVFVAGRNRLENEGAKALAEVFKKLTSLEEVVMPQNGIYHVGISALADGLSSNLGLRILNLNDNTVGPKGAKALAKVLSNFSVLEQLNLGDCLLKTKGAILLADALGIEGNHPALSELNLSFNEINSKAIQSIATAMNDKTLLTSLLLDGNLFGTDGRDELIKALKEIDKNQFLGNLDEDESDDEEGNESSEEEEDGETESDEEEEEELGEVKNQCQDGNLDNNDVVELDSEDNSNKTNLPKVAKKVTIKEFLEAPSGDNFLNLEDSTAEAFLSYAKNNFDLRAHLFVDEYTKMLMKVSALCASGYMEIRTAAEKLTEILYHRLFLVVKANDEVSSLNNYLLMNLGLIKSEDKRRIDWNLEGCYKGLEQVVVKDFFLQETRNALKSIIEHPIKPLKRIDKVDHLMDSKTNLIAVIDQIKST